MFFKNQIPVRDIVSLLFLSIAAMAFTSFGSFHPGEMGFWFSISFAVFTVGFIRYFLNKFQREEK